jgi:hypothetical protein
MPPQERRPGKQMTEPFSKRPFKSDGRSAVRSRLFLRGLAVTFKGPIHARDAQPCDPRGDP